MKKQFSVAETVVVLIGLIFSVGYGVIRGMMGASLLTVLAIILPAIVLGGAVLRTCSFDGDEIVKMSHTARRRNETMEHALNRD